jgi:hypothetical protein
MNFILRHSAACLVLRLSPLVAALLMLLATLPARAGPIGNSCGNALSTFGEQCSLAELIADDSYGLELPEVTFTRWSAIAQGLNLEDESGDPVPLTDFDRIRVDLVGAGSSRPGVRFVDVVQPSGTAAFDTAWEARTVRNIIIDEIKFDVTPGPGFVIGAVELTTTTKILAPLFSAFAAVDVNEVGPLIEGFTTGTRTVVSDDLGGLGSVRVDPRVTLVAGPSDSARLESFELRFELRSASIPEPAGLVLFGSGLLICFARARLSR